MDFASIRFRRASLALLLVASSVTGCGSSVEGGEDGNEDGAGGAGGGEASASSGQVDECNDGVNMVCDPYPEVCDENGVVIGCDDSCDGEAPTCADGKTAECVSGSSMVDRIWSCGCPDVAPASGTACIDEGLQCEVPSDMDCGPATIDITCVDGVWVSVTPRCSLPPCRDVGDATTCTEMGCRWLEPGCGDAPLAEAGCFEASPCAPDSCLFSDEICMNVSVVPACATEDPGCDSCSEQLDVCVPQLVGEEDAG